MATPLGLCSVLVISLAPRHTLLPLGGLSRLASRGTEAYQYAAYAQAMAGYGYPGYSGYGDYASYMQQMSGQGLESRGFSRPPAGGIATDPMSAYYGTSNYDYSDPSRQFGIAPR